MQSLKFFWLCWVLVAVRGFSLVAASRDYSSLRGSGVIAVASLVTKHRFRCTGVVTPRRVESSWTRGLTHLLCIDRQILIHCTAREVPVLTNFKCPQGHWVHPYCAPSPPSSQNFLVFPNWASHPPSPGPHPTFCLRWLLWNLVNRFI